MIRLFSLVTAILISSVLGSSANADPDRSLVRIVIADESATVTASGRTRVNVVHAVLQSLKETKRSSATVTVGPWLRLPDVHPRDSKAPTLTVCIDNRMEGGKTTAYIAISPDVPFEVVSNVSEKLSKCGYDDVRLLSEQTLLECLTESQ